MQRRTFVTAALAAGIIPASAWAQPTTTPTTPPANGGLEALPMIEPQNALERALVDAFENEALRPAFRRALVEQPLALIVAGPNSQAPLLRPIQQGRPETTGFIFTSAARIDQAISTEAPRLVLPGREALRRLQGHYAVLNHRLRPFITIEPDDIDGYLAGAGPEE